MNIKEKIWFFKMLDNLKNLFKMDVLNNVNVEVSNKDVVEIKVINNEFDNAFINSIDEESYIVAINLLKENYIPNKNAQKRLDDLFIAVSLESIDNFAKKQPYKLRTNFNRDRIFELFDEANHKVNLDFFLKLSYANSYNENFKLLSEYFVEEYFTNPNTIKNVIKKVEKCIRNLTEELKRDFSNREEKLNNVLPIIKEYNDEIYKKVLKSEIIKKCDLNIRYLPQKYISYFLIKSVSNDEIDLKLLKQCIMKKSSRNEFINYDINNFIYNSLFIDAFMTFKDEKPQEYIKYLQQVDTDKSFECQENMGLNIFFDLKTYARNISINFFKNIESDYLLPYIAKEMLKSELTSIEHENSNDIIAKFKSNRESLFFENLLQNNEPEAINYLLNELKAEKSVKNQINNIQAIVKDLSVKDLSKEVSSFVSNINKTLINMLQDCLELKKLNDNFNPTSVLNDQLEDVLTNLKNTQINILEKQLKDLTSEQPVRKKMIAK